MNQLLNSMQGLASAVTLFLGWYAASFMETPQWAWPSMALGAVGALDAAIYRLKD